MSAVLSPIGRPIGNVYDAAAIDVRSHGAAVLASADENNAAIVAAIAASQDYGRVIIAEAYSVTGNIPIQNKTGLEICGGGMLTLSSAADSDAYIFELIGTCSHLDIHDLILVGANSAAKSQIAIGNDSGQDISDSDFHDLRIENINIGITFNANLGGTFTRCRAWDVRMYRILGTAPSQGYGFLCAGATHCEISDIHVEDCERHDFYQGSGNNITWNNITSINHRVNAATGVQAQALAIARSHDITVNNFACYGFKDGAILVSHETVSSSQCYNITINGVRLGGRQNLIAAIIVGEQAVPGTYETVDCSIRNVDIFEDGSLTNQGVLVQVINGRRLSFKNFTYHVNGVAAALYGFQLGQSAFIANDADCEDVYCDDFEFIVGGASPDLFVGFNVCSDICTLTSRHELEGKFRAASGTPIDAYLFDAAVTNPNLLTAETP